MFVIFNAKGTRGLKVFLSNKQGKKSNTSCFWVNQPTGSPRKGGRYERNPI